MLHERVWKLSLINYGVLKYKEIAIYFETCVL
jgi:hypothetical protein